MNRMLITRFCLAGWTALVVAPPLSAAPATESGKPPLEKKDPAASYEKAVKDLERFDGPFTFYRRGSEILLELPEDRLGQTFLFQATFHTGASASIVQAGWPLGEFPLDLFRWEREGEELTLIRPNLKYRIGKDHPLRPAYDRSFPEGAVARYPIVESHPGSKKLLANVTEMFTGELFGLQKLLQEKFKVSYQLPKDRIEIRQIRGFETNSVVRVLLPFGTPLAPITSGPELPNHASFFYGMPLEVSYQLFYREETGYRPRAFDPRVGYFTQEFFSFDRFYEVDRNERWILRYDLRKKDPRATLSEPTKPLVWVLDSTIPKKWRAAVREGILRWSPAFEAIGYKGVFEIREAEAMGPDYDHADGRYNVVRWVMSADSPYAISHFRSDPVTGQILSAGISIDGNMIAQLEGYYGQIVAERVGQEAEGMNRALVAAIQGKETRETMRPIGFAKAEPGHACACSYARELTGSASLALLASRALPGVKIDRETFARDYVIAIVAHEIGHCLGLRHNFSASGWVPTSDLASGKPIAASVMDYAPVNGIALLEGRGRLFNDQLGPYDLWAIRYGYGDFGTNEAEGLAALARQSGRPELVYSTDEDADRFNPYGVRFDLGADPLRYSQKQVELAKKVLEYAYRELPKPGESYETRTLVVLQCFDAMLAEAEKAARFVGGVQARRSFRGDEGAGTALRPVSASLQREAMAFLETTFLQPDSFAIPPDVRLTFTLRSPSWDAPMRRILSDQMIRVANHLISPEITNRIAENAYRLAGTPDVYALEGHFASLTDAIYREFATGEAISVPRRDVQRGYLVALMCLADPADESTKGARSETRLLAEGWVEAIGFRLRARLQAALSCDDAMSVSAMRQSLAMVDRFLTRPYEKESRGGG